MELCQELAQRGQDVADFFFFSFLGGGIRGKKKFRLIQEKHRACCVSEQNTGDLKSSANIHTSGAMMCSVMRRGEKERNGFPVLHELAAANMKLTAAM